MPKVFGREMPPIVLGGATIVALYLVYNVLFPGETPVTAAKKPKTAVKKTIGETDYLLTDYTFKVNPLPDSITPKDAFKPLVAKLNIAQVNGVQSIDNFTYSGMASINGQANGLLENTQTGQGDFVLKGQRWHDSWLVVKIDAGEIQLRNDSGDTTTLVAGAASQKTTSTAGPAGSPGNTSPINPMMVGPIGAQDLSIQPDNTQGGGGNGRRRGGRGGGRGGRGGGGGAAMDGG